MDYLDVTELAGDEVTSEQIERIFHRYNWARSYCENKDVLEIACGTGQGLGYLQKHAKSLKAGDISDRLVAMVKKYYGDSIDVSVMNAQEMALEDKSCDVVIIFEAIYYLPSPDSFLSECRRVLRPGGKILLATANKDLSDFNPSPYSHQYFGTTELKSFFRNHEFDVNLYGAFPLNRKSLKQLFISQVKKMAVGLNLIPRTMNGKKFFKRLVYGRLITMPNEIHDGMFPYSPPMPLDPKQPDHSHKVIYCEATLREK